MTFGSTFGRVFSPSFQQKSQAAAAAGGTVTVVLSADTFLKPSEGNKSYGGRTVLDEPSTANNMLVRVILSSIPANATCTAASINFVLNKTVYAGRKITFYEIASANGDWVEGTGNAQTQTGVACGNYKAYNTVAWAGSAGCNTAGTDYIDTALASRTVSATMVDGDAFAITFNAAGLAVIQSWFGQSTNSGLVAKFTNYFAFYAKENATESYRPTLTVTYS
jgi:hypothetical protein